jgi:type I restriction enzyme S subunit
MFGDPITNPMGWEIKKLGEVALEKLSYGSGASAIDFDNEVRYVRITDINDDGSLNENAVSPSVCEDKYLLHCGDILFARTGATVGKTYLHLDSAIKCIYAVYLIRFIPNKEIINPLYAFHFTKTRYYHDFVAQSQRAVAQPNINAQQYSNLSLPLPPLSLQQSFAAKVSAIEAQKQAITQSIQHTEALLAQRMDNYFGI